MLVVGSFAKPMIDIAGGEVEDRQPTLEEQGRDPTTVAFARKGVEGARRKLMAKRRKETVREAAKQVGQLRNCPN